MPSIQILYEDDHQKRALALMNALVNDALADPIDKTPVKVPGLKRLVFWGHGNQAALCNKSGKEIGSIIKSWKDKNSDLDAIEIITCNSRHYDDGARVKKYVASKIAHFFSGDRVNNSIAKQVKRALKYSIYPSVRKIKVLSMPESIRGNYKQYSILLWDAGTTSWCYVTGTSEQDMFTICTNIKNEKKKGANVDPASPWDDPRTGDFPAKLAAAKIEFPKADYSDCVAGTATDLRDILVEVS